MKHRTAELEGDALDAAVALADGRLVVSDEPGWTEGEYKSLRASYGGRHVVRWYGDSGELGGWEPLDNQGSPSTDWRVGGPIIERERIAMAPLIEVDDQGATTEQWCAFMMVGEHWYIDERPASADGRGPTPLIAAMRAFVASKLGEEVELP